MNEPAPRRATKADRVREAWKVEQHRLAEERSRLQAEGAAFASTLDASRAVWVRRQYDGSLSASYRLDQLSGFHLSDTSGGVGKRANRAYVHAYAMCDAMLDGDLDHSCTHGPPPHRIKVCVVGVDNGGTRSKLMRDVRKLADLRVQSIEPAS